MIAARRSLRLAPVAALAGSAAVLAAAAPAAAHVDRPGAGILDGLLHPVTGPDHLLAMLAVGVVAVLVGRRRRLVPLAFLGGLLAGGLAGLADLPMPGAELLIVASVLLLGLAVAAAVEGAGRWMLVALAVAGAAHGHAHGAEAPASAEPLLYVAGFVATTAALHLAGALLGALVHDRRTLRIGMGATAVAAGALLLTA